MGADSAQLQAGVAGGDQKLEKIVGWVHHGSACVGASLGG